MKTFNLIKTLAILLLVMLLSSSLYAQEKPTNQNDPCCAPTENHVCTDECKNKGCATVKAKEAKNKHVCIDECKKAGCASVKAKEKCEKDCSDKKCSDKKSATLYECPMKCVPASEKPGQCPECHMDLKKI